jgi:hypothetical protein
MEEQRDAPLFAMGFHLPAEMRADDADEDEPDITFNYYERWPMVPNVGEAVTIALNVDRSISEPTRFQRFIVTRRAWSYCAGRARMLGIGVPDMYRETAGVMLWLEAIPETK